MIAKECLKPTIRIIFFNNSFHIFSLENITVKIPDLLEKTYNAKIINISTFQNIKIYEIKQKIDLKKNTYVFECNNYFMSFGDIVYFDGIITIEKINYNNVNKIMNTFKHVYYCPMLWENFFNDKTHNNNFFLVNNNYFTLKQKCENEFVKHVKFKEILSKTKLLKEKLMNKTKKMLLEIDLDNEDVLLNVNSIDELFY